MKDTVYSVPWVELLKVTIAHLKGYNKDVSRCTSELFLKDEWEKARSLLGMLASEGCICYAILEEVDGKRLFKELVVSRYSATCFSILSSLGFKVTSTCAILDLSGS